jgi:hypothetical protein
MAESRLSRGIGYFKVAKDLWSFAIWIVSLIGGSSLLYYLGSITDWAHAAGPLGWAVIAIFTMVVAAFGYAAYGYATMQRSLARYGNAKAEAGHTNPLAPVHQHERIDLSQFYHPFHKATEKVRFENCELMGPASIFLDGCVLNEGLFRECDVVVVRPDRPVSGVTKFQFCHFVNCKFFRVTFFMPYDHYKDFQKIGGQPMKIISDGQIGDI